jgi:hypothetical protein
MERRKRSPPIIERYGELPQHHTELSARVPGIEAEAHSKPPVQTAERRLRVDTDLPYIVVKHLRSTTCTGRGE